VLHGGFLEIKKRLQLVYSGEEDFITKKHCRLFDDSNMLSVKNNISLLK
jgi:hypothetical protein